VKNGSIRGLALAAVSGGVSAVTRPSIMLLLPLAAIVVAVACWRRSHRFTQSATHALLFGAIWVACLLPATIRNYIMSGDPVLIASGQAATFVNYNLPSVDAEQYRKAFTGTMLSATSILLRIVKDHPLESLSNFGIKAGFILGMVHWMGTDLKPHPELVLTSICYLLAFFIVPASRELAAAPLHFFVLTHLATLMLSMPSNYGYRLILPMYVFIPTFAAAAALRPLARRLQATGVE
jgi:hypothetical protein